MDNVLEERRDAAAQIQRSLKAWRAASGKAGAANIPKGAGAPLSGDVRSRMEPKLGASLGSVRVHTGGDSAQAAKDLGARAFTVGEDVHFNAGEFAPGTKEGDKLLAHELTHVVQGQKSGIQRKVDDAHEDKDKGENPEGEEDQGVSEPGEPAEQEADAVSDKVAGDLHGADKDAANEGAADKGDGGDEKEQAGTEKEQAGADVGEKPAEISAKLEGVGRKIFRTDDKKGSKPKVGKPVPGLYGQLDPMSIPPGWGIKDTWQAVDPKKPSLVAVRTDVTDPQGKQGFVERGYDKDKKQFVMLNAFLIEPGMPKDTGLQNMIEHKDPVMIDGRGTPTQTFLTMRQMKLLEQKAGMDAASLEKVKMSTIQNIEGICQLNQALRNGAKQEDLMTNNESRRYAETTITQIGKKIKTAKVVGGVRSPFKMVLEHYEKSDPNPQKQKTKTENFNKLLQQYGLTRNDEVLWNYDIEFELMPFEEGK